jgi:hypothetical protein
MDNPLKPSKLPEEKNPHGIHDWATLAVQEAESFVRSQDGYDQISDIIRMIMGTTHDDKMRPNAISQLNLNHAGKIALDLASSLTDIKPFFEYRTTNTRFELQAQMGQKLASAWWGRRNIDLRFADVIRYCMAAGSGYAHLTYNTDTQDLDMISEDPRDVLPIRPSDMISIQNAFGVVIRRERTVNYLRHMYPKFMNQIHADRDGSYAALARRAGLAQKMGSLGMVSGFMGNLFSQLGGRPATAPLMVPVSDVFTIYVHDDSVNETGGSRLMGDADQNWSYVVKPGDPLYPRGRCIVMTRSVKEPLYDGPNIYWHGMFPVPKLSLDPWPWSWFGKSPLKDILGVQKEIDRTARGIADTMEKNWRPDLIADSKTIAKAAADRIDTRRAGLRLRTPAGANANSVMLKYPEMQGVTGGIAWLQLLVTAQKELAGTQELSNLVQLGQIPSSETIERMTESWSPAIRLRSRVMEAFLREVAMITLMNFFQFYTQAQRIAVLGPSGQTFEDFDFDPGTLIPDMLAMGLMTDEGNPLPRYERAREFIRYFTYQIAPGSLLAASEVTDKLMYLQLSRMGFMDAVTLLEKLKVANIAPAAMLESMGTTIMERLQWQNQAGIQMNGGPAGMQGGPGGGPGRPASAQAMPRMVIKES